MVRARAMLLSTLAPAACAIVMVAVSCTSFSTDDPVADAAADGPGSDGTVDRDDGPPDSNGPPPPLLQPLEPTCPAPAGGAEKPGSWVKRPLFVPPPGTPKMYPFSIATDATHVTWAAQVDTPSDSNAYDGIGEGVIMRAPKDGSGQAVTLATGQRFARAVALDDIYAYWVTLSANGAAYLVRTPRECAGNCPAPKIVMPFPPAERIDRLQRAVAGVLFAMSDSGNLYRIDVNGIAPLLVYAAGTNAGLAVTPSDAYASSSDSPSVGRAPVGGVGAPFFSVDQDAGRKGVVPIATDCKSLWMIRETTPPRVLGYSLGTTPMLSALATALSIGAFDLAADDKWLYFGAADGGGIFYVDKATGASALFPSGGGNVWRIAVDREGVYYGQHDRNMDTGSLYMFVKK